MKSSNHHQTPFRNFAVHLPSPIKLIIIIRRAWLRQIRSPLRLPDFSKMTSFSRTVTVLMTGEEKIKFELNGHLNILLDTAPSTRLWVCWETLLHSTTFQDTLWRPQLRQTTRWVTWHVPGLLKSFCFRSHGTSSEKLWVRLCMTSQAWSLRFI